MNVCLLRRLLRPQMERWHSLVGNRMEFRVETDSCKQMNEQRGRGGDDSTRLYACTISQILRLKQAEHTEQSHRRLNALEFQMK